MVRCEQMSSSDFEKLLKLKPDYSKFGFSRNPFSIHPLFADLDDDDRCKRDQRLFFKSSESEQVAMSIGPGKRILIYGDVGVGKTTLLNLTLYLAKMREKYLPVRVLVSEDNVSRAVQEIMYTVCMEIVAQIKTRKITQPITAVRRWLVERREADKLYDYLSRLVGTFEEEKTTARKTVSKIGGEIGTGAVPGGAIKGETESEETIINSLRTHVESLPAKVIENYFRDLSDLAEKIGYGGIITGIDEADHIRELNKVVGMLTVSRGLFFISDKEIFVIAGSNELIKQPTVTEGLFDSTMPLKPLTIEEMKQMLEKRTKEQRALGSLDGVFDWGALSAIHEFSRGLPKLALKIAENSLTEVATLGYNRVERRHVLQVLERAGAQVSIMLEPSERRVLEALRKIGEASPSSKSLQKTTALSRQQLDRILRKLCDQNIIQRRRDGKAYYYRTLG